jgi:hypothetical protein
MILLGCIVNCTLHVTELRVQSVCFIIVQCACVLPSRCWAFMSICRATAECINHVCTPCTQTCVQSTQRHLPSLTMNCNFINCVIILQRHEGKMAALAMYSAHMHCNRLVWVLRISIQCQSRMQKRSFGYTAPKRISSQLVDTGAPSDREHRTRHFGRRCFPQR